VKVRPKAQLTLPEEIRRALFFTPEWLAGERESDEDIAAGRGTAHESAWDMFSHLDALGAADA
jgi:antitoxin PrlF